MCAPALQVQRSLGHCWTLPRGNDYLLSANLQARLLQSCTFHKDASTSASPVDGWAIGRNRPSAPPCKHNRSSQDQTFPQLYRSQPVTRGVATPSPRHGESERPIAARWFLPARLTARGVARHRAVDGCWSVFCAVWRRGSLEARSRCPWQRRQAASWGSASR